MTEQTPPSDVEMTRQYKKKAFENLLQYGRIYLTFDTRAVGVKIPSEYQGKSALTVLFGLDMPIPLKDLAVDENGIEVTLSFERRPHHCAIPWDAVWYLVPAGKREGILFAHSLPEVVRKTLMEEEVRNNSSSIIPLDLENYLEDYCCKTKETPDNKPRHLKIVDDEQYVEGSLTTKKQYDVKNGNNDSASSHRLSPQLKLVVLEGDDNDDDDDGKS